MVFLKRLNLFTTILFTPFVILCLFLDNIKFFKAPLICGLFLLITGLQLSAQICGTSGLDGPQNALPPINTYFPLASNTTLNAGTKSIMLQAVPPNDPNYNLSYGVTEIKPGDLILIIQMQDATFNYNDSDLYGSGSATSGLDNLGGTGYTSIGNSGKYEYVVATSFVPLTGGLLTFRGAGAGKGAVNTYVNQNFTTTRGQRRFQIVRVPQYSTLVLSSNLTTPPYNGSVGGIIAFDVAGTMKFNGFSVDASERGFRGGYGPVAGSGANTNSVYAVASSSTRSVGKGEGIAGTPRFMWDGFNQVDNLVEGLPGGSYGRGAPANAGGAGNDHNAGGGGGANGGYGGIGGRGWQGAGGNLNPLTGGGRPGFILPADMARLIMGGGGGGGDANNATSGVKGGVGGGIILINVEKIDGFGLILSNGGVGQAGAFGSAPDGAGGGGAGGSIFVRSLAPSATANLVIEAKGGNGGNTKNDNNNAHGPGGGGGGGLIFTQVPSAIISTDVIKGLSGKSNNGASISHGAEDGTNGSSQNFITSQLPIHLQGGGSICYPSLNVTLSELNAGPGGIRNAGTTATYKLRVYNNVSGGNAGDVKVDFELPYGFTLSNVTQTLTGDAVNTGTFGFTPGATGVMNFGSYNISPGDYVEFTISINIANNVPSGIYHASAQATYLDPTRTNANPSRKITANSQAFNGYNTTYETGGLGGLPVSGTNYNGNLLVSSQEDVYINAAIIASDCDAIVDGSFNSAPVGEYNSPNYLNKWKVVNNGDKVKIVNDGTLKGALIRDNGADKFSLKQTVNGIKALSFYTLTFDYRNWQGASCSNAASKLIVQILDSTTNNLIILSPEFNSTASPQVATISFTTLTNTKSLIIKVYDPGSPNPACGAFVDNFSITSPLSIQFSTQNIACFGLNTGKLIITSLNGAAGPYKLSYSANGGTNYSAIMNTGIITNSSPYEISNLLAGNYLLKIVDENGCTNIKQFEIKEPLQLNLTGSNTSILCNGAYSTVTLTANGGVSPYNYSIDGVNYVSQNTFPDLTAGSYTFTVKDVNNCLKTTFISIGEPSLITLSANLTPIKCFGETASVSLTASGGTGVYNYSIDGISFQLSNVFLGVLQGPQIFRVRDANNCIKTVAVDVIEPDQLTLSAAKTDILCYGGTSTVTLSAGGGTGAYQYSKDGGATFSASSSFGNLVAGNYSFIVKDANACATTIAVSISEPTLLTLSATKTDILCYGGNSTVTLSAGGGTGAYQYSKDGITFQDGITFSGLIAGNYSFIVKDANACATTIAVSITEPDQLTLSSSKTDILCNDGTSTVTLSANGGTGAYQYSKDGGVTFSASNSFGNLLAGNYSFIVKDANACAITIAVSITEPSLLTLSSSNTDILCYGGTSNVTLSAGGGTGFYQYSKDGITFQVENTFSSLIAGTYSFTVKDANACATTIAVSISEPDLLTLSSSKTDILCNGGTSTVTLSANGGTGTYQYSKDGITFQAENTFVNLVAATYSFVVKDANACATTIAVSISEPALLTLSSTKTDILCNGGTSTVTLSAAGGTGAYQFSKDGGTTFSAGNTFSGLIAGTYSFIVKDANACATTIAVSISEPSLLTLSAAKTDILCYGGTSTVTLSAGGGTGAYQYSKDGGVTFSASNSFGNLLAGTYSFIIKDANACATTIAVSITEPSLLTLSSSKTDILCNGGTSNVTISAGGGTGTYQYSKDGGTTFQASNSFVNLVAATYSFVVKDANACATTIGVSISEPTLLTLSSSKTDILCFGGTSTVTLSAGGGTGVYQYSKDGVTFQAANTFSGLIAGNYSFIVKDANACSITIAVSITEPDLLTFTSSKTDILCYGETSTMTLSAAGGTGAYQYSKDGGANFQGSSSFENLVAGNYSFIVKDANACATTIAVSISEPTLLTLSATKTDILCYGGNSTVTLSAGGGTGAYQYSKDGGVTFSASNSFGNLLAGTYSFIVKDANACATTIAVSITEPDQLTLSSTKTDILCYGGTSTVTLSAGGGTGAYQYSKDGGVTFSSSDTFGNLVAGNYSFIVKDANACSTTIAVSITEPSLLTLSSTKTDILCYGGTSTVTLSANGGTGAYQYSKDGGVIFFASNSFGNLLAGNYSFIVKDANACAITIAVSISEPALLTLTSSKTDILCYGGTSTVTLSVNGGTGAYQYSKDGGVTFSASNSFGNLLAGNYSFIVKDANACATTIAVSITEPDQLTLSSTKTDILCSGGTSTVTLSANGGTGTYQYSKDGITFQAENTFSGLTAGNYSFIVKDANACATTIAVSITEPSLLTLSSSNTDILCYGGTSYVTISAGGGTGTYQYSKDGATTFQAANTFSGLIAGNYSFIVKDANACATTISVSISEPALLTLSAAKTDILCYGGTSTVTLSAAGGAVTYQYSKDGGATFSASNSFGNLLAGTYSFIVKDANACTTTIAVSITEPDLLTLSSAKTDILCYGGTSTVTLSANGGTGSYQYSKDGGTSFQTTNTFSSLIAGNYSFIVKDANACATTIAVSITEPALLTLSATKTDILCNGGTSVVTLSASGGTGTYQYSKDDGTTFQTTNTFSGLTAGNYSFIVKDANACATTIAVSITEPSLLTLSSTKTDILCYGGTSNVTISAGGGTGTYQYSKDGGTTFQAANTFSGLTAGNYSFIVKDANACAITIVVSITEPSLLTLSATKTDILCYGATSTVTLSANGGTGAYQYSKDGGTTFSAGNTFSGLIAGTYSFIVKDANACSTTIAVSITEPSLLTLSSSNTDILCNGGTSTVTLSAGGGTGAYLYSKDGGVTFSASNSFGNLLAGNYSLIVKDANACSVSINVAITEPALLTLSSNKTDILCYGGTSTVTLSAGGGTGTYQYSKDGGATFQSSNSFGNLVAGNYSFIVKDVSACATTIAVSISAPSLLTLSSSNTDILCNGGTSTVTLSANGGTGVYQYSKDGGTTFSSSNSFSNLVAGNYSFIVKDANACATTIAVSITEPATLSITENHIDVLCFGSNTGKINLNITGGYAPYTYLWSNGNGTKDLDNLIAGVYTVLVTDANNCSISKSITISSPASPLSIKETHQNNICFGDVNGKINITISGGTAPYSHIWSNGAKSKDLSGLSSGTYELLVTDKNNCNATIRVSITPLVKFSINEQLKQVSCFGEKNGKITLELTGGEAPYDIKWSNKLTGKKIENLAAGSYTYIAKDALGCEIAGVVKITEPLTISSQITVKNSTCKFSPDGAILIEVKGGTAPYQFYWNGFDRGANNSLLNIAPGKYTVNIIDANNCSKQIITEVLPGNCAPNANDDAYTTNEDTPITILTPGIIINDLDPDDDDLIISLASVKDPDMQNGSTTGSNTSFKTKNGFVTLNQNGSFTYTPNKNFYGVENFIYKVTDGALNSNLAIVTIRVNAVNDPPIAQNDFYTTLEDVPVNGSVAPNDSDPENEPLSFTLVVPPATGTLVFKADGTFIYTPEKDFNGIITFNYQVCDPQGLCDQAVATITITPVNDPPIAVDDQFYLQRNLQISASVAPNDSEPDGDPTTFTLLTQPKNGILVFNANGTFTYQPNNGFKGTDAFNYRICDPFGLCDNAVVDLIIQPLVTVKLTPANGIINEGENINITAELTESIFQDVTITIQFNGSAINDTDYKLTGNYQQITISAGQTTTTQKFNIAALLDDTRDDNEHVIASISSTSSPAFVNIGTGSEVIIKDIYPESIPSLPTENPDINPDPLTSPNGDGNGNDSFIIYNINNYPNNEVIIFNRWGNEVYRTKNYNNRDNSFRGVANVGILTNSKKELVDGVYYYIIYTTQNGEKKMNKGYLILKR